MDPLTPSTFLLNVQTQYKYTPLPDSSAWIRLVHIRKNRDGTLAAVLVHHEVENLPSYEALSYEWGQPGDHVSITVDSCPFHIQTNLATFLNTVLPPPEPTGSSSDGTSPSNSRLLFVDAICVDQENVAERNQQVQLMRHIYMTASSVLSWLGPSAPGMPLLFKVLQAFTLGNKRHAVEELCARVFAGKQDRSMMRHALLNLVARTYWSRTWIVQELVLAKEIVLYCGNSSLLWSKLNPEHILEAGRLFKGVKYADSETTPRIGPEMAPSSTAQPEGKLEIEESFDIIFKTSFLHSNMLNYFRWRGGWDVFIASYFSLAEKSSLGPLEDFQMTLERALTDFGSTKCMDARDRIYALMGIVKRTSQANDIKVNYGQNLVGLFFDAWQHMDETKDVHDHRSVREIVKQIFSRLGLQEIVSRQSGTPGRLGNEILKSIPPSFASRTYPVQIWRAGKLASPVTIDPQKVSTGLRGMSNDLGEAKSTICAWTVKRTMDQRTNDWIAPRKGDDFLCYSLLECSPAADDIVIGIDASNCGLIVRRRPHSGFQWEQEYSFTGRCILAQPPLIEDHSTSLPAPKRTSLPFGRKDRGPSVLDTTTSQASHTSSHISRSAATASASEPSSPSSSMVENIAHFLNRRLLYLEGSKYTDPEGTFARPSSSGEEEFVSAEDLLILSQDLDPGFFHGMQMADWYVDMAQQRQDNKKLWRQGLSGRRR